MTTTPTTVTMRVNHDTPASWMASDSFNMEHAITLLAIGRHEWPSDTQPRTDRPVRFANLPISGTLPGNTKSFTFRLYYTR